MTRGEAIQYDSFLKEELKQVAVGKILKEKN